MIIKMIFPSVKLKTKSFWQILGLFLFWRILTLVFVAIAPFLLSIPPNSYKYLGVAIYPRLPYLSWVWANYDGAHYLAIARWGYTGFYYSFFPVLPLLIHLIHRFLPLSHLTAGVFVSNLAFLISLYFVYQIILLDYNRKVALKTLFFLIIFPLSFYFGFIYSEGLFLLFTVLSFYYARRANWLKAGIFGYLAALTRFFGIALFPALLVEWAQQNYSLFDQNWKKFIKTKAYFIFLIPLGLITYAAYLQIRYDDFLLFQKSLANWGQNKLILPPQTAWRYLKIIFLFPQKKAFAYWLAVLEFISSISYFILFFFVLRKIRFSYGILMLSCLIIPVCTGTLHSMPRYLLPLFPGFLAIALLVQKNKKLFWAVTVCFLALGLILTSCFARGYFTG